MGLSSQRFVSCWRRLTTERSCAVDVIREGPYVSPIFAGEAADDDINLLLQERDAGILTDSGTPAAGPQMMGIMAHVPEALRGFRALSKGIATVTDSIIDPVTWELMALRGAVVSGCHW
jgi:hypothetical protein